MIEGECHEMTPGNVVLRDWSRPFLGESTDSEQISIIIPRDMIERSDFLHSRSPFLSWDSESPSGRILSAAIMEGWDSLGGMNEGASSEYAGGFIGLLNGRWNSATAQIKMSEPDRVTVQILTRGRHTEPSRRKLIIAQAFLKDKNIFHFIKL